MGNANRKAGELPDQQTGMTENEVKLVQQTWRNFCKENREYGVLLFISMFVKHPEYLKLFKNFRGKAIMTLKDDPVFRAHGCSIGYHLTSMVESLPDPPTFEVLVRRNAAEHLRRRGVKPHHFEVMGQCLVDVLQAKDERHMTPAAIEAWGKFLTCMVAIIKDVYDKAAAERAERGSMASVVSSPDVSHITSAMDEALLHTGNRNNVGGVAGREHLAPSPKSPTPDTARMRQDLDIAKQSGGNATGSKRSEVTTKDVETKSQKKSTTRDKGTREKEAAKEKTLPKEEKH